jgi:peptide/nickel transport system permease protein
VVRGVVLSLRERSYVESARAIGAPLPRILFRHIAPNTLAPVIVQASVYFAGAILTEAALGFLGVGTPEYIPSWGNIISSAREFVTINFWISFFPGLFLASTILAANLVGDGLRDVLDPRLRGAF